MAELLNPHDVDPLAAHAHPFLYRDLTKGRATSVPMLDAIARASTMIGAPTSSALVLGLAAKDVRAQTAAQDALLELAAQLAHRTGRSVELPTQFQAMAAGTSSSMLAKVVRRLT